MSSNLITENKIKQTNQIKKKKGGIMWMTCVYKSRKKILNPHSKMIKFTVNKICIN